MNHIIPRHADSTAAEAPDAGILRTHASNLRTIAPYMAQTLMLAERRA